MEGAIVLRFRTSKVVCFCFRTLPPGLTFDDIEDILDRKLQQGEAVNPVGSEWALLRVREWLLLESALSATLDVDKEVSELRLWFCSVVATVEK